MVISKFQNLEFLPPKSSKTDICGKIFIKSNFLLIEKNEIYVIQYYVYYLHAKF